MFVPAPFVKKNDASPQFVGHGTVSSAVNTNLTLALPIGWQPGDFMVAFLYLNAAGNFNTLTGWTDQDSLGAFGPGYSAGTRPKWRFAQLGDTAPTFIKGAGGADGVMGVIAAWRGVNVSTPFEAATATEEQSTASMAYTNITTLGPNRKVVQHCVAIGGSVSGTPHPGYLERLDDWQNVGTGVCLSIDEQAFPTAGAIGTGTRALSASRAGGNRAFALVPA